MQVRHRDRWYGMPRIHRIFMVKGLLGEHTCPFGKGPKIKVPTRRIGFGVEGQTRDSVARLAMELRNSWRERPIITASEQDGCSPGMV